MWAVHSWPVIVTTCNNSTNSKSIFDCQYIRWPLWSLYSFLSRMAWRINLFSYVCFTTNFSNFLPVSGSRDFRAGFFVLTHRSVIHSCGLYSLGNTVPTEGSKFPLWQLEQGPGLYGKESLLHPAHLQQCLGQERPVVSSWSCFLPT